MWLDSPWVWLSAVLAGWVFLGLAAGRFEAARRQAEQSADPSADLGPVEHVG